MKRVNPPVLVAQHCGWIVDAPMGGQRLPRPDWERPGPKGGLGLRDLLRSIQSCAGIPLAVQNLVPVAVSVGDQSGSKMVEQGRMRATCYIFEIAKSALHSCLSPSPSNVVISGSTSLRDRMTGSNFSRERDPR